MAGLLADAVGGALAEGGVAMNAGDFSQTPRVGAVERSHQGIHDKAVTLDGVEFTLTLTADQAKHLSEELAVYASMVRDERSLQWWHQHGFADRTGKVVNP